MRFRPGRRATRAVVRMDDGARHARFRAIYEANHARILGYALRRVAEPADAADAVRGNPNASRNESSSASRSTISTPPPGRCASRPGPRARTRR